MQTHFSPEQLAKPDIADAQQALRACVHCGFCMSTCPTYLLTGDERDGPRGRIYLIKDMLEKDRPADPVTVRHLDRCLTCLSCMTTCPSGVNYMHLVDHARHHVEQTYTRPIGNRLIRSLLGTVLANPALFRTSLWLAKLAKPFRSVLPESLRAMIDRAPLATRTFDTHSIEMTAAAVRTSSSLAGVARLGRVALMPGCVQPVLRPQIDAAATRVLNRSGLEVTCVQGTGCCGALAHHLGHESRARSQATANIEALTREADSNGLDAIVVTASGCGTMIKDYGFIFRNDPAMAEKAARISALARDVTEVLAATPSSESAAPVQRSAVAAPAGVRVAYHSACSLQHGQKITTAPKELLIRAGFDVVDIPEAHVCCGSAGTYSMLQPEMSSKLAERKARNIESVKPHVVATGNIACINQIEQATGIPVVHTVELLDWAAGGVKPAGLPVVCKEA